MEIIGKQISILSTEKTELNKSTFPTSVKASIIGEENAKAEKIVKVDTSLPTISQNQVGGDDGRVNLSERDAGLVVSGKSDADAGSLVTITLLNTSDEEITSFGSHKATVQADGSWSMSLPKRIFQLLVLR